MDPSEIPLPILAILRFNRPNVSAIMFLRQCTRWEANFDDRVNMHGDYGSSCSNEIDTKVNPRINGL